MKRIFLRDAKVLRDRGMGRVAASLVVGARGLGKEQERDRALFRLRRWADQKGFMRSPPVTLKIPDF